MISSRSNKNSWSSRMLAWGFGGEASPHILKSMPRGKKSRFNVREKRRKGNDPRGFLIEAKRPEGPTFAVCASHGFFVCETRRRGLRPCGAAHAFKRKPRGIFPPPALFLISNRIHCPRGIDLRIWGLASPPNPQASILLDQDFFT